MLYNYNNPILFINLYDFSRLTTLSRYPSETIIVFSIVYKVFVFNLLFNQETKDRRKGIIPFYIKHKEIGVKCKDL